MKDYTISDNERKRNMLRFDLEKESFTVGNTKYTMLIRTIINDDSKNEVSFRIVSYDKKLNPIRFSRKRMTVLYEVIMTTRNAFIKEVEEMQKMKDQFDLIKNELTNS